MYGANWCVGEQISTVEDSMGVKRDKWEYRETNGSEEIYIFHLSIIL